jgi:hypothetical protein
MMLSYGLADIVVGVPDNSVDGVDGVGMMVIRMKGWQQILVDMVVFFVLLPG